MHEFSIVNNIIEIAIGSADQNGLKNVSCVEIEVGNAAGIEPSAMEFAWESARKNTILENARLVMHFIPLRLQCRTCGIQYEPDEMYNPCPACGDINARIMTGKELRVVAIES
jgi:hydrogenase nickel incorporation protein HypA/HybF